MTLVTENQTPIKQRLLEAIRSDADRRGRYPNPVSTLGKAFGLNHHDLQKNLFQLEKEGFIQVEDGKGGSRASEAGYEIKRIKLRRGAINEQLLRGHKPLSVADRVRQWILRAPQQQDGWVHATPTQIREAIKSEGNTVSVAISNMQERGELEVRREGHRIVAMRMIAPKTAEPVRLKPTNGATREQIIESTYEPSATSNGDTATMPDTPELDRYLQARRFNALAPEGNPYLQVDFTKDPIAEEAILLRDRLREALGLAKNGGAT